jgi:integrase
MQAHGVAAAAPRPRREHGTPSGTVWDARQLQTFRGVASSGCQGGHASASELPEAVGPCRGQGAAVHFHDPRHTGNTRAAQNGATRRELMDRMGHTGSRATLIYLHVSKGLPRHIAASLSAQIKAARANGDQK